MADRQVAADLLSRPGSTLPGNFKNGHEVNLGPVDIQHRRKLANDLKWNLGGRFSLAQFGAPGGQQCRERGKAMCENNGAG